MDATTTGNTLRWYEDLEDELVAFLKAVPPQGNNRKVWSPKLATILVEACTLTESVFYHITPITDAVGDRDRDHMGLAEYAELYRVKRRLAERKVVFFQEPLGWVEPFHRWANRTTGFKDKEPAWWKIYNEAKHHRLEMLEKATLKMAICAVAGAFVTIVTESTLLLAARRHEWLSFNYDRPEVLVADVLEQRSGIWLCPETPLFAALLGASPLPDDINKLKDPSSPIPITSPRLVRWLGLR